MASLRNIDRTDLEMLHIVHGCEDDDHVISSQDVADAIGITAKNGRSPAGRVSSRLSWMARYGQLERLDSKLWGRKHNEAIWTLTEFGTELLKGKLPAHVEAQIINGSVGKRVLMIKTLSASMRSGNEATAVRRQWQHDLANRRA